MPRLTGRDGVHVLDIGDTENRFTHDWIAEVDAALDEVLAAPAPLVTTGTGKFFSNGLDVDWIMANVEELPGYSATVQRLYIRILTLPVPTIAAVNGHAFGAGAMLAIAHDWRLMRADRGYFCFPEVDIQMPFTTGMAALIQCKLTPNAARDSMTTGQRFGGSDAVAAGLVDGTASETELVAAAIAKVAPLAGKPTETLGRIKSTMYADAVARLADTPA